MIEELVNYSTNEILEFAYNAVKPPEPELSSKDVDDLVNFATNQIIAQAKSVIL